MAYSRSASSMLEDYTSMRTLPAMLSVAFIAASLYQFGGISEISIEWVSYTLTAEHAVLISLGTYAAAFASSETKRFEHYESWEQAAIAAGPAVIVGAEYIDQINDVLMSLGDPLGYQVAFVLTVVSWGVAVQ